MDDIPHLREREYLIPTDQDPGYGGTTTYKSDRYGISTGTGNTHNDRDTPKAWFDAKWLNVRFRLAGDLARAVDGFAADPECDGFLVGRLLALLTPAERLDLLHQATVYQYFEGKRDGRDEVQSGLRRFLGLGSGQS